MDGTRKRRRAGSEAARAHVPVPKKRGVWADQEAVPKRAKLVPETSAVRARKQPAPAPAPAKPKKGAFADEASSDDESAERLKPKKTPQDAPRRRASDSPWAAIDERSRALDRRRDIERRKQAAAAANRGAFHAAATKKADARRRASPPRPAIPKKKKA